MVVAKKAPTVMVMESSTLNKVAVSACKMFIDKV